MIRELGDLEGVGQVDQVHFAQIAVRQNEFLQIGRRGRAQPIVKDLADTPQRQRDHAQFAERARRLGREAVQEHSDTT